MLLLRARTPPVDGDGGARLTGLAWLLGAVGLYGVMALLVAQRTREIAVGMALGAQRGSVSRLAMAQAGRLAAIGIVSGGLLLG